MSSTETVKRLVARVHSDLARRVTFEVGMRHFTEMLLEVLVLIEDRIAYLEFLEKNRSRKHKKQ